MTISFSSMKLISGAGYYSSPTDDSHAPSFDYSAADLGYAPQGRRKFLQQLIAASPIVLLPLSRKETTDMQKAIKMDSLTSERNGSNGNSHNFNSEEEMFQKLIKSKEKTTTIHLYIQDALGQPNQTVWEVARSTLTEASPTEFGQVRVIDDLFTEEPDRNSKKLGRAQGIITFSDLSESALTMNLNFYFTGGKYKGSSICIIGRNPILNENRELPIVGGTGVFRMARGYSISNTYSYDPATNYGVLEYTFYVAYADQEE